MTIFNYKDFGRITSRKVLYIIALTSVFWLSMNVLLLIANNESARSSLEQLAFTSNELVDSHYMRHVNIQPLAPAHKPFDLPWLKKEFWENKLVNTIKDKILFKPGYRIVYDKSKEVNKNPAKGEGGEAAYLDTEEEKKYAESIFKNHSFNSFLSDKISLDRTMKDVRGERYVLASQLYLHYFQYSSAYELVRASIL